MKLTTTYIILTAILLGGGFVALPVAAQTSTTTATSTASTTPSASSTPVGCLDITNNLYLWYRNDTLGEITKVQDFLRSQGVFNASSTGWYGMVTHYAVRAFQRVNGVPVTGSIGPKTRLKIKEITCGGAASSMGTSTSTSPTNSTLILSSDSAVAASSSWPLNGTTTGIVAGSFNVRSEIGVSKINTITTTVAASGSLPTTVHLYDGANLIASRSGAATISFGGLNITVNKDQTKTLTFKIDVASTSVNNTTIKVGASSTINYKKPDGSPATVRATNLMVNEQRFFATSTAQ